MRVSGQGQLVIPAQVRKACGISEGDLVIFEVTADGLLLKVLDTRVRKSKRAKSDD